MGSKPDRYFDSQLNVCIWGLWPHGYSEGQVNGPYGYSEGQVNGRIWRINEHRACYVTKVWSPAHPMSPDSYLKRKPHKKTPDPHIPFFRCGRVSNPKPSI
ncbi:hypothetical protein R6Q59_030185 [Mikania micrantha]